ncbi:hypothetical protein [Roseicyclus persicicus]|nr:hypothetical protein [Roseibacterium persicicum]
MDVSGPAGRGEIGEATRTIRRITRLWPGDLPNRAAFAGDKNGIEKTEQVAETWIV